MPSPGVGFATSTDHTHIAATGTVAIVAYETIWNYLKPQQLMHKKNMFCTEVC